MKAAPPVPPVSEEEAKAARLSPRLTQSLRKRLGLSQMALARLVGVIAAGLEGDSEGLGAVGAYKKLAEYTTLGGVLTVFSLP